MRLIVKAFLALKFIQIKVWFWETKLLIEIAGKSAKIKFEPLR